jgi:hypothetical protein
MKIISQNTLVVSQQIPLVIAASGVLGEKVAVLGEPCSRRRGPGVVWGGSRQGLEIQDSMVLEVISFRINR